jgi:hypothetical protein
VTLESSLRSLVILEVLVDIVAVLSSLLLLASSGHVLRMLALEGEGVKACLFEVQVAIITLFREMGLVNGDVSLVAEAWGHEVLCGLIVRVFRLVSHPDFTQSVDLSILVSRTILPCFDHEIRLKFGSVPPTSLASIWGVYQIIQFIANHCL